MSGVPKGLDARGIEVPGGLSERCAIGVVVSVLCEVEVDCLRGILGLMECSLLIGV